MANSELIAFRTPHECAEKLAKKIAKTGKDRNQIAREALAQYLGVTLSETVIGRPRKSARSV